MLNKENLLQYYKDLACECSAEELCDLLTNDPFCANIAEVQIIILTEILHKCMDDK